MQTYYLIPKEIYFRNNYCAKKIQRAWKIYKKSIKKSVFIDSDEEVCPICMNTLKENKNICITECSHKFCCQCIIKHSKKNNNCPLCRTTLVIGYIKPEFTEEDIDESYNEGFVEGVEEGRILQNREIIEETNIRVEEAFERGKLYSNNIIKEIQIVNESLKMEVMLAQQKINELTFKIHEKLNSDTKKTEEVGMRNKM